LTIGGTVFPWIAFSLSNYKLPHYIFVLFPLVAILTGAFIRKLVKKYDGDFRPITIIQYVICALLLGLGILMFTLFPIRNIMVVVIAALGAAITIYYITYRGTRFKQVLFPSFFAIVTLNFVFNAHLYPAVLKYESGNVAAHIAGKTKHPLTGLNHNPFGMDFYNGKAVPKYSNVSDLKNTNSGSPVWIYTDSDGLANIRNESMTIVKDTVLQHFHVSTLNAKFLAPKTRSAATQEMHLVLVKL
jgi:hypothetical protein